MTIKLLKDVRIAGAANVAGTELTASAALEADLVQRGIAEYVATAAVGPGRQTAEQSNLFATRNPESPDNSYTVNYRLWNVTRLAIGTTETLVTAAPCIVGKVFGNTGNTGYTDIIDAIAIASGSPPKHRQSIAAGAVLDLDGEVFVNGLCVDGELAGHDVSIQWRPL